MLTDDQILEQARRQFREDEDWEREIRDEYREDMRFAAGKQWPANIEAQRIAAGRPAPVHNRLPTFIQSVTNEARQNKPSLGYSPVEDADKETAKLLEGIARHIQYDSQASVARETAVECQAKGSFGFYRLVSEYAGPDTFDQELKIKEVVNPLSVYGVLRPAIMRQKCRHAFVVEKITREEYRQRYGESAELLSFAESSDAVGWIDDNEIRVAEYWWIETTRKTIALLSDGSVIDLALVPQEVKDAEGGIKDTRSVEVDTVRWCKTNGAEILPGTKTTWVGSGISIYAVLGGQAIVDDKPMLFSLIRFMRSPQQLINYAKARIAETLMTAPISPFIGAEGQFENHELEWELANREIKAYLPYKPVSLNGQTLPPPQRNAFEPPIAALSAFLAQEIDELKAISGIFDPSLGNKSNETSGRAIQARQQQSSQTNMHFLDNLGRADEQCGRDLAEAIPKIYDGTRVVRILGEDETRSFAKINEPYTDEQGQPGVKNDISAGKYDVTVRLGRTFNTKRLETFDTLGQLIQGNPNLLPTIGDIVFRNSDMAGAEQIAERFKKMLPPALAEDDAKKEQAPIPPQIQAQMQAMGQQIEQLTAALNQSSEEIATKRMELESRERIAALQEETKRVLAVAKMDSDEGLEILRQEVAAIRAQVQHAAAGAPTNGRTNGNQESQ